MNTTVQRDPSKYIAPQATNASKSQVMTFAESLAKALAFAPGSSIEGLVERIGGKINYLNFMDSFGEADGSLFVNKVGDFEVRLSGITGPERNRFTIAHELGHYFLHFVYSKNQQPMRATRSGTDRVEWEANWFAGAFLMPQEEFRRIATAFHDADRVAAYFNVSRNAAQVRATVLGVPLDGST